MKIGFQENVHSLVSARGLSLFSVFNAIKISRMISWNETSAMQRLKFRNV